jgi:hypothetical protein
MTFFIIARSVQPELPPGASGFHPSPASVGNPQNRHVEGEEEKFLQRTSVKDRGTWH